MTSPMPCALLDLCQSRGTCLLKPKGRLKNQGYRVSINSKERVTMGKHLTKDMQEEKGRLINKRKIEKANRQKLLKSKNAGESRQGLQCTAKEKCVKVKLLKKEGIRAEFNKLCKKNSISFLSRSVQDLSNQLCI